MNIRRCVISSRNVFWKLLFAVKRFTQAKSSSCAASLLQVLFCNFSCRRNDSDISASEMPKCEWIERTGNETVKRFSTCPISSLIFLKMRKLLNDRKILQNFIDCVSSYFQRDEFKTKLFKNFHAFGIAHSVTLKNLFLAI